MRSLYFVSLLGLSIWVTTAEAYAADPENGATLAAEWCSSCHATGSENGGTDVGPAWTAIAADPEKDDDFLTGVLTAPHWPMENIALTHQQIGDLIVYIRTLENS